jgi:hypothetical protein
MTQPPDMPPDTPEPSNAEDTRLMAFLQANQPPVPGLSSEQVQQAEAKLMAALTPLVLTPANSQPLARWRLRRKSWVAAMVGIASVGIVGVGHWLWPPPSTTQHLAQLEQFLEASWDLSDTSDEGMLWLGEP